MKTFRKALQGSGFPITAEFSQPGQMTVDELLKQADLLAGSVDAIQLAENPGSGAHVSPQAMAALLIRHGIDPLPRLSCRDRNRIALQSDLLGLRALGISSLIINRGNQLPPGREKRAKPVFELSCQELVAMAHAMNEENWSDGDHEFVIGTGAAVAAPGPDWTAASLVARASAGARFLQTQPCFNLDLLDRYMQRLVEEKLTWSYSVIVTLAPLPSAEKARWLLQNNRNTLIPDAVLDRIENAPDPEQEGIDICVELMQEIARIPGVSGINVLSLGNPDAVIAAIEASGLRPG
jgi:methylenetetrahydrofolate reductase (NADPH)